MDSIKKLADKRLSKDANTKAVDALTSYISNNPGVQYEDLVRKSLELGQEPSTLIDRALGSVIVDKNSLNLKKPTVDLLNEVYESNPTPGYRYVVDPANVKSAIGKEIAKDLGGSHGVASGWRYKGESRGKPDFIAIEDAKDELGKMQALVTGGHEFKHSEDRMIRPHFKSAGKTGELGHHYGSGTFEADDLIKKVRDLPDDEKILKEIAKRSKGLDKPNFRVLKALPIVGPVIGAGLAAMSGDANAASAMPILGEADSLGPEKGSEDYAIENPQANPAARRAALQKLSR
jgi:hypothetical protein